jgi:NTP pyrophosphatase (non-canonical NTP hydrolase)
MGDGRPPSTRDPDFVPRYSGMDLRCFGKPWVQLSRTPEPPISYQEIPVVDENIPGLGPDRPPGPGASLFVSRGPGETGGTPTETVHRIDMGGAGMDVAPSASPPTPSGLEGACRDVLAFHAKFAPDVVRPLPTAPPPDRDERYAMGFIREELREIESAMRDGDLPAIADGLADLIYVTIRAALILGIDLAPVWAEVQRANMAKVGGHRREDAKILKPLGWCPPDVAGVLARQQPIAMEG